MKKKHSSDNGNQASLARNQVLIGLRETGAEAVGRARQSVLARRLLQSACFDVGTELPETCLEWSALDIFHFLQEEKGLHASIAHCSSLVAVALSLHRVGVDCEAPRAGRNWRGIADTFFTRREAETINAAGDSRGEALFLKYWVLKEAFIKATRGSIWSNLNDLEFDGSTPLVAGREIPTMSWKFRQFSVGACAVGACVEGNVQGGIEWITTGSGS